MSIHAKFTAHLHGGQARPPVVVVMGHIDHGKSTLLDYIRKASTAKKEAGGITQHISAYEGEYEVGKEKRRITFLDTPGHEAFCSLRERGASVADIAVLVVSAEDGVKPQTVEALKCICKDDMPFIVALSKIDKTGANIDKIKQNLAENEILVEGWGGEIPLVPVSGKTGEGVPELLEIIALQADLEDLKGNPNIGAEGFVIETNLDPKQGISATIIIKDGTLKTGMYVASEGAYVKVRNIENFKGETIGEASFSSPVRIIGWNVQPKVSRRFKAFAYKEEAIDFADKAAELAKKETEAIKESGPEGCIFLTLVVKADTSGSLEALEHELQKLGNEKIMVRVISKGIGSITETDVKTANIKKSLIIGFNVGADKGSSALAMRDNVEIKTFNIIYELIDYVKEKIKAETPVTKVETTTGFAKVLRTFSKNKDKQVLGGRVTEGEIKQGSIIKILRREAPIGEGKIKEIQVQKIKTDTVAEGQEFGLLLESKMDVVEGDTLKATAFVSQE